MSAQAKGEVEVLQLQCWRGQWVVSTMPQLLNPLERPGTHCAHGWMVLEAGLDMHGKSCLHQHSIPTL
jgi:hypothetical protein